MIQSQEEDEFYVGYLKEAPPETAATNRKRILLCALIALAIGSALAVWQARFGNGNWNWNEQTFTGLLEAEPTPSLLVLEEGVEFSIITRKLLVAPYKIGGRELVKGYEGKFVSLKGTSIGREGRSMIEVTPGSITEATQTADSPLVQQAVVSLGTHTLVGEIVDSKCYLGVMNPGHLKTHRACAVRCISGGVPPVLLVRDQNGQAAYLLLTGPEGEAINEQVLDFVAEPVRISGPVERRDDLLVLRIDPAAIQRLE